MSQPTDQQPSPTKRPRSARSTKPTAGMRVAATDNKAAVQPVEPPEASSQSPSSEPPVEEKWGEFPRPERQAQLKKMLEAWDQEPDHGNRPSPFAEVSLSGASVYWLAALVAGDGDVGVGEKTLNAAPSINLSSLHLEGANLTLAHLEGAKLYGAHLEDAALTLAHLERARLNGAHLERASLAEAHLEGANLRLAHLTNQVDFRGATFDVTTNLADVHLDATLFVADVLWNGVPLTRVDWRQVPRLGDEAGVRQPYERSYGRRKYKGGWVRGFEEAARAYRQLAVVLRGQGITEAADRFTYRAFVMQRKALWWRLRTTQVSALGSYLFSLFLAVLTGYGFRMWRIIAAYLLLILTFAGAYWSLDLQTPHIYTYWQALILSVTAFHGRVFSNPFLLTEPQIIVTAIEAIFGLVIEGVFIAMLTQRFFNR